MTDLVYNARPAMGLVEVCFGSKETDLPRSRDIRFTIAARSRRRGDRAPSSVARRCAIRCSRRYVASPKAMRRSASVSSAPLSALLRMCVHLLVIALPSSCCTTERYELVRERGTIGVAGCGRIASPYRLVALACEFFKPLLALCGGDDGRVFHNLC
jgi:hypothetical protein